MIRKLLFGAFISSSLCCFSQRKIETPLPVIVHGENNSYGLQVDGKPFMVLGAQLWNSSSWPYAIARTWPLLKTMNCNTLEAPVYWQVMEPQPGSFRFDEVDSLVFGARAQGLRLILLWFGTFKNGSSSYAPVWLLNQTAKYPRMLNKNQEETNVLSVVSDVNLDADKKAFAALMKHLKQIDRSAHTVIMVQVENESGSLGTDRDYSAAATAVYNAQVPETLLHQLKKSPGTWKAVFGKDAVESFSAYTVSRYINEVAVAGKNEYPLPMYVNCWIKENSFQRAAEYPAGGPVSTMMPIWKATAPALSLLAPDIYFPNPDVFRNLCSLYARPDNPLFVPEMDKGTDFARNQFYAVGEFHAIGIAVYGIDFFLTDPKDERIPDVLDSRFSEISKNYRLFAGAMPVLHDLQASNKLAVAVEDYGVKEQLVSIGNYDILFNYGLPVYKSKKETTGRVLIGQLSEDEFLVIGFDARFQFRPKTESGFHTAEMLLIEQGEYVDGKWQRKRLWNGDEAYHSTLPQDGAILKITLRKSNPFTD